MKNYKNRSMTILALTLLSSCKPTITLDHLNPLSCGDLCQSRPTSPVPPASSVPKLSLGPVLGLEKKPFSITDSPVARQFGLIDLDLYETSSLAPLGVLRFTDNQNESDTDKVAWADFSDHTLDSSSTLPSPQKYSSNLSAILSRLSEIYFPVRKYQDLEPSIHGQISTELPTIIVNNMINPESGEVIKIKGSPLNEKLVIDLFGSQSKFYFDGVSSTYQRSAVATNQSASKDIVEFRRSLEDNMIINLKNINSNTILSSNSNNEVTGTFINPDYFFLGTTNGYYLNGEDPNISVLNKRKFFNIVMNNYRTKDIPLSVSIGEPSSVNLSNLSDDYQEYLQNPTWINWSSFNSSRIVYSFQSLLKEGLPMSNSVDLEKNQRWNNYGNPHLKIELMNHLNNCSTSNNLFEVKVSRGKNTNIVSDNFCGVRNYSVGLKFKQTLDVELTTQSLIPAKHFVFDFTNSSDNNTNPSKLRVYVPSNSKEAVGPFINFNIRNNMDCGNRIVNHKFGNWFDAPDVTVQGLKCINDDSNVVAVDNTQTDITERVYNGFKKIVIYDHSENINNWSFTCELDSTQHNNVNLTHTDPLTNKKHHIRFFDMKLIDNDGNNYGICGKKLKSQYPSYFSNGSSLVGTSCSVSDVMSGGTHNCVSDEVGRSVFRAEFVDLSLPEGARGLYPTLNSFVGVPEPVN